MSTGQTRLGKQPASGLARIKIVTDQRTSVDRQELDQQAGEQHFPDTRVTRGDDLELRLLRHASERTIRFGWTDSRMKPGHLSRLLLPEL